METLRILHVIPDLRKGGAERLVADICNELNTRENIQVKLLVLRPANEYRFLTGSIDIVHCDSRVTLSLLRKTHAEVSAYAGIVESFQPHIIHSHLYEAEVVSREILFDKVRYFSHLHSNIPELKHPKPSSLLNKRTLTSLYEKFRLLKRYRQCSNRFIAVSADCKAYLLENTGISADRIRVLPNAIDLSRFTPGSRKEGGITRLISIGSLVPKKNHQLLIKMMSILVAQDPDIHLTLLGDGPMREELGREIREKKLESHIDLKGNVDHPEEYLRNADLYVHSALYEPFGLVLVEAMASGLPVISTDGKGNRDILKDGESGYLIDLPDPSLMAEKVRYLASNPGIYSTFSANALAASHRYGIKNYVDHLLGYYRESLEKDSQIYH